MFRSYQPFILRRFAEGRILTVNAQMPFELVLDCFKTEQPFFMVWQMEDNRVAVIPNATYIPADFVKAGFGPETLLPAENEYVTLNNCPYPVIITSHAVKNFDEWVRKFSKYVIGFATQPLCELAGTTFFDATPLKHERTKRSIAHVEAAEI